jgi:hypothetical protein
VARKLLLVAAWSALLAIVMLTTVPPNLRPTTNAPHDVEHAAAFLIVGILFGLAYAGRERILTIGAMVFCATIEILQLYVPGRHAHWIERWWRLQVSLSGHSEASLLKSADPDYRCQRGMPPIAVASPWTRFGSVRTLNELGTLLLLLR